jgi:hypothetical protein
MVLVPRWNEEPHDKCIQRFVDTLLLVTDGMDQHTDLRPFSKIISGGILSAGLRNGGKGGGVAAEQAIRLETSKDPNEIELESEEAGDVGAEGGNAGNFGGLGTLKDPNEIDLEAGVADEVGMEGGNVGLEEARRLENQKDPNEIDLEAGVADEVGMKGGNVGLEEARRLENQKDPNEIDLDAGVAGGEGAEETVEKLLPKVIQNGEVEKPGLIQAEPTLV